MDFIDEFEFKPLTEGLGFNKRAQNIKKEIEESRIAKTQMGYDMPTVPKSLIEKELMGITPEKTVSDAIRSQFKSQLNSVILEKPKPKITYPVVAASFPAMMFDAIFSFAISLIFLIALVFVTRIDILSIVRATSIYLTNQVSLVVLYVAISQLYIVIARTFCGQTLGEWAFDIQLGTPSDQQDDRYPLKVLARSLFVTFTGVILLPFLSLLLGNDLASRVSGLRLYRNN
ncbi:MAG: RDD family protein [Pseudomonadota bacterium]|nr:RDD family protein [Pseudomonadota bacterium]